MSLEHKFSRQLVSALRGDGWWVQPIESTETGCGIPDLYMCRNGCSLWMELKAINTDGPTLSRLPWRPGQYAWLHDNDRHDGLSFVGIKYNNVYVFSHIMDVDRTTFGLATIRRATLVTPRLNIRGLGQWLESFK